MIEAHSAAAGLTDSLVHLKKTGGGISQKEELATLIGDDSSSLVRVLDIHEPEHLIERRRDQTDGRARLIHLTAVGEDRITAIRKELARADEALLCSLSDEEIARMLEGLDSINRRMEALAAGRQEGQLR